MDEKLYKVFSTMPVKGVFGNYGEASRYRLMAKLAGRTSEYGYLGDKTIRDRITVILYPDAYGDKMYLLRDGYGEVLKSVKTLDTVDGEAEGLLVPARGLGGAYLVEFPGDCQDIYGPLLGGYFSQGLFFEAFPYDKKSFEDMVAHMMMNSPSRMPVRIVLIQNEVQYGATDVTSQDTAVTKAVESMKKYTKEIQILPERQVNAKLLDYHIDVREQYILKKRQALRRVREELERDFDMEFQESKERFLLQESGTSPGILSSTCFMEAADYSKIKGTSMAMEAAVFHSYLEKVRLAKEDLKAFLDSVWSRFMWDIAPFSEEEKEQWVLSWIDGMLKGYRPRTFFSCPGNPIEYRRQLTENRIVVEIESYVNSLENGLKNSLYQRIEKQLKKCEEKYL